MNNTRYFSIGGILWKIISKFEYKLTGNVLEFQNESEITDRDYFEVLVESYDSYDLNECEMHCKYNNNEWLEVKCDADTEVFSYATDTISPISKLVYKKSDKCAWIYINKEEYNYDTMVSLVESTPFLMLNMLVQLENKGFLIHTSAFDMKGKGMLFSGESGAGKTTLTSLISKYSDYKILTDETAVVRLCDDKIMIYGTPWKGSGAQFYSSSGCMLKGINFIYHGLENKLETIEKEEAIRLLIKQSFPYFWDKSSMAKLFSVINSIIYKIEMRKLFFLPDNTVVDYINRYLREL